MPQIGSPDTRCGVTLRTFLQGGIVVNEPSDELVAVTRVLLGVQYVLVPIFVEVLRPRNDCLALVPNDECQELPVLLLGSARALQRPAILFDELAADLAEIEPLETTTMSKEPREPVTLTHVSVSNATWRLII